MNASAEWLSAFVGPGLEATDLRRIITDRVATVDAVESMRQDLAPLVVGRVVEASRHPDSDHLWVTKVDAGGGELLDVVCGAPNVTAGARYPFAGVGVTMPNGMKIERRKIRGQLSNGMLCSARELGLGTDHEGVLALDTAAPPGTPLLEVLKAGDVRLVIDVMPNRPDLLSHLGVAREVAAATGRALRTPALPDGIVVRPTQIERASGSGSAGPIRVSVESSTDCPAYLAVHLAGIRIGPSPEWLVSRLATTGVRSVNNVVDVTNYMLHGYGQPMHAFDATKLGGHEIRVRRANPGERLVTLDGVERVLGPTMLVIADGVRAQGVAGVIGGHDSEITDATTEILIEIAAFDPKQVRATRRALGVSTDASFRFERSVHASSPEETVGTAIALLEALAGARATAPPLLISGRNDEMPTIALRASRVAQLLGVAVPPNECARLLTSVGFIATETADGVVASPPAWRGDARAEIDLIEEVARLRGYETFPEELRPFRIGTVPEDPLVALADRLRDLLAGRGFLEVRPMPFVADRGVGSGVKVSNPLAETESYLRGDLVSSLARRAEFNLAHMEGDLRLFEIGTAFSAVNGSVRPREEVRVAALCMGARRPAHFTEQDPPRWDVWDARALAESIAQVARPGETVELEPASSGLGGVAGAGGDLWLLKSTAGLVGRVTTVALDAPPWAALPFGVEITISTVESADVAPPGAHAPASSGRAARPIHATYSPPPSQPAAWTDVTLLVPVGVPAGSVERVLRSGGEALLESVELRSEFSGESVPEGYRSISWRLTFRHPERTLREKEVEGRRDKLLKALESTLGVRQRTA